MIPEADPFLVSPSAITALASLLLPLSHYIVINKLSHSLLHQVSYLLDKKADNDHMSEIKALR